jgi:hypothetical protein
VSTPEERRRYREQAGSRHEKHAVAVARTLAQRPALRGASPRSSRELEDVVAADLAALRAYLCGEPLNLDLALRSADASRAQAHAACLVSGLRVLPAYRGAVFRSALLDAASVARYTPGALLVEPGFVAGATTLDTIPLPPADESPGPDARPVRYAIWSQTARRTGWLDTGVTGEEAVFATGAEFLVLDVTGPDVTTADPTGQGAPTLVLLRERPRPTGAAAAAPGPRNVELTDADRTTLDRLRAALATASQPSPAPPTSGAGNRSAPSSTGRAQPRHRFPIGLDANGLVFERS